MRLIEGYLEILARQGRLWWARTNAGATRDEKGRPVRHMPAGTADLLVLFRGGRVLWIEVKTPKGRLRESQRRFQARMEALAVPYSVVRSFEDARTLIDGFLRGCA